MCQASCSGEVLVQPDGKKHSALPAASGIALIRLRLSPPKARGLTTWRAWEDRHSPPKARRMGPPGPRQQLGWAGWEQWHGAGLLANIPCISWVSTAVTKHRHVPGACTGGR